MENKTDIENLKILELLSYKVYSYTLRTITKRNSGSKNFEDCKAKFYKKASNIGEMKVAISKLD